MQGQQQVRDKEYQKFAFRRLFSSLWQAKLNIVLLVMLTLLLTMLYVTALPAVYQASSRLLITYSPAKLASPQVNYQASSQAELYFNTEIEILRSEQIALSVIDKLNLQHHPEFLRQALTPWEYWWQILSLGYSSQFKLNSALSETQLLRAFKQRLAISPVANSHLVDIRFQSWDRLLAQQVSVAVAEAYIDYQRHSSERATGQSIAWLLKELQGLEAALQSSELALQSYLQQHVQADAKGNANTMLSDLQQLISAQLAAQRDKAEARSALMLVKSTLQQQPEQVATLVGISIPPELSELGLRLSGLKRQQAEITQRLTPSDTRHLAMAEEIIRLESTLLSLGQTTLFELDKQYQLAAAQEQALSERLRLAQQAYQNFTEQDEQFKQLNRELESNARLYHTFLEKFRALEALEGYNRGYTQLVDRARLPEVAIKPQKVMLVVLAGLFSALLGSLLVLLKQAMSRTFSSVEQLEDALDVEVVAEIPRVKVRNHKWLRQGVHPWLGEPLRSMRARLQMLSSRGQVVMFTSAIEGEGKTSLSIQTASACCDVERVLLIDADLRRASVSSYLSYSLSQPGLTHLLSRTHSVSQCIHRDNQLGFDVLTAGLIDRHSTSLLASKKFKLLLQGLRQHYDRIVIETGPLT
ncbi:GumC family protein, partial [Agarivorans sp.]|uniref:GumC family protein n=1 Tax=Agarivorans sp. TaxID=1872412 RepID=UPI003CFE60D4